MKTYTATPDTIKRQWFVVDAEGKTLGRMASEIATILRGKHKPEFTPHMDTGDYVVVINADKVKVTGNKTTDKIYYWHTEYPGGIKQASFKDMIAKDSTRVIHLAVKGMLPRGPLGRAMRKKLRVFAGAEHTHEAQQPTPLVVGA